MKSLKKNQLKLMSFVLIMVLSLVFFACPTPAENNEENKDDGLIGKKLDFEDLTVGTFYYAGDTFTTGGYTVIVLPFQWTNLTWTSAGYAHVVSTSLAGGSGNEININNVNLGFVLNDPIHQAKFKYGEYGGNVNLGAAGKFDNQLDFDFVSLSGITITQVKDIVEPAMGTLTLAGLMPRYLFESNSVSFVVGGQELWIDDVEF